MDSIARCPGLEVALVQLPGRMRRALGTFRKMTGLTAVTSLATSPQKAGKPSALAPPVHPRCARRIRSVGAPPCAQRWLNHVRSSRQLVDVISHTCPLGLRCLCLPIRFGDQLVGMAKLVADRETSDAAFSSARNILKLVVSETCHQSLVSVLSEKVWALRRCVAKVQRIRAKRMPSGVGSRGPTATIGAEKGRPQNNHLVERALAILHRQYRKPDLSLEYVARTLGCNPRYLTHRFTRIVGERMHVHLVGLRVDHACRLLIDTTVSIKEIAYASGFLAPASLARAFRQKVGVSPSEYRRIFSTL